MIIENQVARKVWDENPNEEYRRDQSHWRGYGRWKNDEKWKSIGDNTLKSVNKILAFLGEGPEFWKGRLNFLEWGPGGGANLFALSRFASRYYGVDISEKNLEEASRVGSETGYSDFVPILLNDDLDRIKEKVLEPIDVFLSTAVFQHFPSKEYGVRVLNIISDLVRDGGIGLVQIRFDNGVEKYRPILDVADYEERHITANSYLIDEFYRLCLEAGFQVLYMDKLMKEVNYITFALQK